MMHSHQYSLKLGRTIVMVLILVVMDDALALSKKSLKRTFQSVLILVVMDDALARINANEVENVKGLNPCCNG